MGCWLIVLLNFVCLRGFYCVLYWCLLVRFFVRCFIVVCFIVLLFGCLVLDLRCYVRFGTKGLAVCCYCVGGLGVVVLLMIWFAGLLGSLFWCVLLFYVV